MVAAAYRATDFLADVRRGVWKELESGPARMDPYRRNLQRTYLDLIHDKLNGRAPVSDDSRPFFRGELRSLSQAIAGADADPEALGCWPDYAIR